MTALLVAALALLALCDPIGYGIVHGYSNIAAEHPLQWSGRPVWGLATWWPERIRIDTYAIAQVVPESEQQAVTACAAVHEAVHLRNKDGHELPMLYQYMCLDRLGASRWWKDAVYRDLQAALSEPERERE